VELGRFSVEYRKTFGESPSRTLQRANSDNNPGVTSRRFTSLPLCPVG
jgi:hypothetical protein